jgi:hypothetical protein
MCEFTANHVISFHLFTSLHAISSQDMYISVWARMSYESKRTGNLASK